MQNTNPEILLRPAKERGHANHGWLDSWHTFSFSSYHDPRFMGFRNLRVINEDFVAAGAGFPTHPHNNMEIVTYVIDGAVAHKDSMGNGSTIRPGEIQRMTAGTGITHSEFNPLKDTPLHLLQIWMLPTAAGLTPSYEQLAFSEAGRRDQLLCIASRAGSGGEGVQLNADVRLFTARLGPGARIEHPPSAGRYPWVQVVSGEIRLGDVALTAGDGAALLSPGALTLHGVEESELLVFELP